MIWGWLRASIGSLEEGREDNVPSVLFGLQKHYFKTLLLLGKNREKVKLVPFLDNGFIISRKLDSEERNSEIVIPLT